MPISSKIVFPDWANVKNTANHFVFVSKLIFSTIFSSNDFVRAGHQRTKFDIFSIENLIVG